MKIVLSGATGAMGRTVTDIVRDGEDEIVLGYAIDDADLGYPIVQNLKGIKVDADVLIDFSHPSALSEVLDFAVDNGLPAVIATTGLGEGDWENIRSAAKYIPLVQSGNYSAGIALLKKYARELSKELGDSVDIEIVEMHHNKKADSPSGTALMLGEEVAVGRRESLNPVYGRNKESGKREKSDIGYHSIRGGSVVGEHSVYFFGLDEVIEIRHSAQSKKIFATGALRAAKLLVKSAPGLYTIDDLYRS